MRAIQRGGFPPEIRYLFWKGKGVVGDDPPLAVVRQDEKKDVERGVRVGSAAHCCAKSIRIFPSSG